MGDREESPRGGSSTEIRIKISDTYLEVVPFGIGTHRLDSELSVAFQVAKPRLGPYRSPAEDEIPRGLSPLPKTDREGRGRPAFGTRKYRYLGNHSEGNRFIKDTQL